MRVRPATSAGLIVLANILAATPARSQDASRLSIDRIFRREEFASEPLPTIAWMRDGRSYVDLRPGEGGGTDIVRVDLSTGAATVLVGAAALVDDRGQRLEVEELELSPDETKALLFHSSVRVWRTNTRGMYHVVDLRTKKVMPVARITTPQAAASQETDTSSHPFLGKAGRPSFLAPGVPTNLQMFAKFSPDGRRVAFVRDNDLFVADLATGAETRLTSDGSADIINGTTDWVYEEELGLRDAFRWSPDGRRIAFWRFDQSPVPAYPMVDETALYPSVAVLRYPKAGAPNSRVRIGVLEVAGGATRWLDVGGDTGQYVARMEWLDADSVVIQRLPRKQNRVDVLVLSATSGRGRTLLTDVDSAYVDVEDQPVWINGGRQFLWSSDRSGWRQIWLYDRAGRVVRQVTRDGMDVLSIAGVDERRGELYVVAAAPDPTQRQVFRYRLDGKAGARSPAGEQVTRAPGAHEATLSPGGRYLMDVHSTVAEPTTVRLYELPAMRERRVLAPNARVRERLAALSVRAPEFFRIPSADGKVMLDAFRIVPPDFDSTKAYPVLMYVYGGPASPTVVDQWRGTRYLWHQMLAQEGYVVVSVDNRGSAWRGRDFRKMTQYHLGRYEAEDQIAAARWLAGRSWVDGRRIGIWGWSYGGYMTTLAAGLGGDVFRAAVAVAPVTDWRLYDTIYTERFMWLPQVNAAGYRESAPQTHARGITARLLLLHGTGDDNVHPQNTIQLADILQAEHKPFYMVLYPNRTHSISGGNSQAHVFETMTRFIRENL